MKGENNRATPKIRITLLYVIAILKQLYDERTPIPIWNNSATPWDTRRNEIIKQLSTEEYGSLPKTHNKLSWDIVEQNQTFCAGKVTLTKVVLTAHFGEKTFSFPIYTSIPNTNKIHPFFVHINFSDSIPDKYLPLEELCDAGFAVISIYYQDISKDDNDFTSGLAGVLFDNGEREEHDCGKIAMWSWAASRAMDYAQSLECLDKTNATVIGHSRLGKTALLTGALDNRFSCTIANNSGCSGAAISRNKQGETIEKIIKQFPYWFCKNYLKYANNEHNLQFDQHFLIASIAPRKVYVASAEEDLWADPISEFLSCYAANEVYIKLGLRGLVCPNRLPQVNDIFQEGNIAYHMRKGTHYLSRQDWNYFISYLKE